MTRLTLTLGAVALGLATQASAQTVLSGDHSVTGNLCAGQSCTSTESFANEVIKLKDNVVQLRFEDTSTSSFADRDWILQANEFFGSTEFFSIVDAETLNDTLKIEGGAPDNALYVAASGNIGIGTSMPTSDLHVQNGPFANLRLESGDGTSFNWDIEAAQEGIGIYNDSPGVASPFQPRFFISQNAPQYALSLNSTEALFNRFLEDYDFRISGAEPYGTLFFTDASTGNVGVGTNTPDAPFEVSSNEAFNFFRLTATGATIDSVDITYTNGPLDNGELRYNIVDGDGPEMRLDGDGKLTIVGELITAGSCSVGCDAVFNEDYALKSIEEHQAQMWTNGYLPNVGPTPEDGPFNVSDKMGRMLNELEHAHIYIGQLHDAAARDRQKIIELEARYASDVSMLTARLEALEEQ